MPITVHVTDGVLTEAQQHAVFAGLTDAFLELHHLSGNRFLTPNVVGEVNIIPRGRSFAGGKPQDIVVVELKVPSFALSEPAQKAAFVARATEIVSNATGGRHPRERIFVNMVYAVDGLWGIDGHAHTNAELGEAVARAAAA